MDETFAAYEDMTSRSFSTLAGKRSSFDSIFRHSIRFRIILIGLLISWHKPAVSSPVAASFSD